MNNNALHQAKKLLKFASKNNSEKIRDILNNLKGSTKYKGDIFEYFLAGLYEGNGWITVVCGGKDDKGVDILLYQPRNPSKVHVIVQAKNLKTRLSKKDLRHEYANFFGDEFSSCQGSSDKYDCKTLFIISLNGYAKNTENFNNPKEETHQVHRYEWSYIESLIQQYSQNHNSHHRFLTRIQDTYPDTIAITKKIMTGVKKSVFVLVIIFILFTLTFVIIFRSPENQLTEEMVARLDKTALGFLARKECQRLNYPLERCREKLVYKYTKIYGSLKNGLIVHFCGPTNFKKGNCKAYGEKKAQYVITGEQ